MITLTTTPSPSPSPAPEVDWTDVCDVSRLTAGRGICALINETQIAIFRIPTGAVVAVGNHDPFSGVNVISRGIVGSVGDQVVVASPMYKQRFDLVTGICLDDESVSLPVFSVREVAGRIEVADGK
jgi:nitrite reductase (NADH) small subunit